MIKKEEAKQKIATLIEKFKNHPKKDNLSEEETREFITELFKILNWDFKTGEVSQEEKVSKGFVDYGFHINDIPVFFVEAKRTSANLQVEKFVNQAIDYAWHKATTWTVLTNFQRIRVFNSYIKESIRASQLFDLEIDYYLDQFDKLWLLSKESFEKREIDKYAEEHGGKIKERPVEKQLFEDLNKWRQLLADEIRKNYRSKYIDEEIDEIIQLLLDRLILIRKIEDEGLESRRRLEEIYHTWLSQSKRSIWSYLKELFSEFNGIYNSKIFSQHELDKLEIGDWVLKQILPQMYESSDKTIRYNFSFIDSDILGSIYEQYLGYLLKTKGKKNGEERGKAKRKEQGIYYTPRHIVDYIVKNTLGELLKDKKVNPEKIRILDLACGSGSFLLKAFDFLDKYYSKKDKDYSQTKLDITGTGSVYSKKVEILTNNIFGVDLDPKAVEIAQLNLLLKIAEKGYRLPLLQKNIICGNSLIDHEKYDKYFEWKKQFKEIMDKGGFDIVIGNPPYFNIRTNLELQKFCKIRYPDIYNGQNDVLYYFVMNGINLLKENGYLGFIVSRYFLESDSAKKFREFILKNSQIKQIIDFGNNQVFDGANVLTCIIILKKGHKDGNVIEVTKFPDKTDTQIINNKDRNKSKVETLEINQNELTEGIWIFYNKQIDKIISKIESNSFSLGSIARTGAGIQSGENDVFVVDEKTISDYKIEKILLRSYVKTRDLKSYLIINRGLKVIRLTNEDNIEEYPNTLKYLTEHKQDLKNRYEAKKNICKWFAFAVPRNLEIFDSKNEKIITPIYSTSNKFGYDSGKEGERFMTLSDTAVIQLKDFKYSTKAILAILNSKLMDFYYKKTRKLKREGYYEYLSKTLEPLPIKYNEEFKLKVVQLVDKILVLKSRLNQLGDKKISERDRLEEDIQRVNDEIDNEVFKVYGINEEERRFIEKK